MSHSPWWKSAVIYQTYIRSFQDSNGDGIGDIPGIIQRLDYLEWLGIDAVWVTPFYPSPMADFGYDVSDHTNVDPVFGTLSDIDSLIRNLHGSNLKILIDFVAPHTSDRHQWFIESRSSRFHPKRDWYIWKDPNADGGPPNNWLGRFDGLSAWEWDGKTEQYYLHSFLKEQPDINWRNPDAKQAMLDVLHFWLQRGVDGIRVDAAYRAFKDPQFRDNPVNPDWHPGMEPSDRLFEVFSKNIPEIHDFNRMLRTLVEQYGHRLLIGELYKSLEEIIKHYGSNDELHLPLNSELMSVRCQWSAECVREIVDRYERLLPEGAWPNWTLGNHDKHRVASRIGISQAKIGMMLLLTLRGTPTIYYGEELGMEDAWIPSEHIQDPWEKKAPGIGVGRDCERTPMLWDRSANAGFCPPSVWPWLPITHDYSNINVEAQKQDSRSFLSLTRALLHLRRQQPALQLGDYVSLYSPSQLFCYRRFDETSDLVVALNFSSEYQKWVLPIEFRNQSKVLLSTFMDRQGGCLGDTLELRGNEGLILERSYQSQSPHTKEQR
ncbi:alpha-amylase family glycosyl hydrolase [Microseira wollei]|uniref:Glycosyl hydrolase, family 13 n=1 Tax=Microseira wollei NIES-4236 TaxID=2530354 RepID=A0AAV3XI64_9CYAN|nr:alpha-amylase family glycosyl hydrolase [Microseira wollei]GET41600.1 glycosyl hydrolase, family 13 [Microseira wollei NIES-4236]